MLLQRGKLPEYYTSIDFLPEVRWDAINKGAGLENLLIKKQKINEKQKKRLEKVWKKLQDEFIAVFGFSEQVHSVMEKRVKIARLKLKRIMTGDESILNFIKRAEKELETITRNMGGQIDIYEAKIAIEKHNPGLRLPINEVSVREFHTYLKDIESKSKKK